MNELIRFNYMHRDSGNWKKFGSKIFSNPEQLTIEEIEQKIHGSLIDQEYFYPDQCGIKKFKFHRYLDDYSWYEFESIEILDNSDYPNKRLVPISNFILQLKKNALNQSIQSGISTITGTFSVQPKDRCS